MNRQQKTLMILGGGGWQTYMVEQAKQKGLRTVVIDWGENPPARALADSFHQVDTSNASAAIEVARRERINGVATFGTNDAIVTVACIKEALGLPSDCVSSAAARRAVRKDTMREDLAAANVPIPRGRELGSEDGEVAAREFFCSLGAALLFKPSDGSGGKGMTIVRRPEDIPQAIARARQFTRRGPIVLEEFIEGTVLGVESITQHGKTIPIAIADKMIGEPPYCITLGVIAPSALPPEVQERVLRVNEATIRSLKIESGPTHIDMVVDAAGIPRVIDVGPRLAGGPIIFEIIKRTMGVDMMDYVIEGALGRLGTVELRWTGLYAGSRHFPAFRAGIVRELSCPEEILARHRSTCLRLWKKPGDEIAFSTDSSAMLGFAVCVGDTFVEVCSHLEAVAGAMRLTLVGDT